MKKNLGRSVFLVVFLLPLTGSAGSWNAKYHILSQGQFNTAESELASFNFKGTERMLDAGCGTGKTTALYANHVAHGGSVLGIDSSPAMIEFAQKEYAHVGNLAFRCADVSTIWFDAEFDIIFSYFCLHWVPDRKSALNNFARSLKPGGRAYLYITLPSELLAISQQCSDRIVALHPEWQPYITNPFLLSPEQWIDCAQEAGFQVIKSSIVKKERTFANKVEHKEYINTIGIAQLPDAQKMQYSNLLVDMLYDHYGVSDDEPFTRKNNSLVLHLLKEPLVQ